MFSDAHGKVCLSNTMDQQQELTLTATLPRQNRKIGSQRAPDTWPASFARVGAVVLALSREGMTQLRSGVTRFRDTGSWGNGMMKGFRWSAWLLGVALVVPIFVAGARAAPPPSSLPTPQFRRYEPVDGLPGSTVYSVVQDHQGFMWFGVGVDLVRYDGV
ncbi:MAG TPA: two-component regulator propeller domain-containing protein, partial [Rhodanobacter sp.]|nr:two-component regulator propeller domain-containing protein [Rhodanobacter sp.]